MFLKLLYTASYNISLGAACVNSVNLFFKALM